MSVIYSPKGMAGEYAKLALNIFTKCPHGCTYCFAPAVMRVSREAFAKDVVPRNNLLKNLEADLKRGYVKGGDGKEIPIGSAPIHLCFVCDPYPKGVDSTITREVIKKIKKHGYNVQVLTKNGTDAVRDFDLLGKGDWFGFSFSGYNVVEFEPYSDTPQNRIMAADLAMRKGINTWVSCEPVIKPNEVEAFLKEHGNKYNLVKIGKPNYVDFEYAPTDWNEWGKRIMEVCCEYGVNAVLKSSILGE